jgi:predicted GNAT family acetyltransferase
MENPVFANDTGARRYRMSVGGEEVGYVEYDPVGSASLLIKHTEVAPAHEGKGYAAALVRHVLEDLRARGMTVIPICPYTMGFVRRHREYLDVVREDLRGTL